MLRRLFGRKKSTDEKNEDKENNDGSYEVKPDLCSQPLPSDKQDYASKSESSASDDSSDEPEQFSFDTTEREAREKLRRMNESNADKNRQKKIKNKVAKRKAAEDKNKAKEERIEKRRIGHISLPRRLDTETIDSVLKNKQSREEQKERIKNLRKKFQQRNAITEEQRRTMYKSEFLAPRADETLRKKRLGWLMNAKRNGIERRKILKKLCIQTI